jgi:hypothetical protein
MILIMGEQGESEATLGAVLLRAAGRAGYSGPGALAYVAGRLGPRVSPALMHERVPPDWVVCEEVAARHGVDVARLWDLLLEDRPVG